jgi:hypothetical protein
MPAASRRRWSYSLRTLFVLVTVFAISLGYYGNWARQRRAEVHWLVNKKRIEAVSMDGLLIRWDGKTPTLPWLLQLFGEEPEAVIVVAIDEASADDLKHVESIRRLFPEAQINTRKLVPFVLLIDRTMRSHSSSSASCESFVVAVVGFFSTRHRLA